MVAENLSEGIAFQIRATRDAQGMTQTALAEAAGMSQNNVSRLESPDYGKHTVSSLKRIAQALDVALIVRLVPFSQYIDWLSGRPHLDRGISVQALAVPEYAKDSGLQQRASSSVVNISGPEPEKPSRNLLEALNPHDPQSRIRTDLKLVDDQKKDKKNGSEISASGKSVRVPPTGGDDSGNKPIPSEPNGISGGEVPLLEEAFA